MQIQAINQTSPYASSEDTAGQPVSLSQRAAAASGSAASAESSNYPHLQTIYDYLVANQELMLSDPNFGSTYLNKVTQLKNEDGKASYQDYETISAMTIMLKEKLREDGIVAEEFFTNLTGRLFGVTLITRGLINTIFFPADYGQPKYDLQGMMDGTSDF